MSVPMSSKASLPSRSTSAGVCFAFAGKNAHRTFFSGSCEDGIEFGIRHTDNTQIGTEWSNRSILRFSADLRAQKDLWSARAPGKHRQPTVSPARSGTLVRSQIAVAKVKWMVAALVERALDFGEARPREGLNNGDLGARLLC
jgi:hypothetical protein